MANKMFDLPMTKGTFQVRGIVSGVEKDSFYTEKTTKTGKEFRMVNFGVEYEDKKTIYSSLNGMPRDKVYFSKKGEDGKTDVKAIAWKDRTKKVPEGYRMIGVLTGLQKIKDENGKIRNDNKTLTEYDACEYINENLQDGDSVFVKGNLEFSSYTNKNDEVSRSTKFIPTQISLCKNEIDFEDEEYTPSHDFTQTIVFTGIEQERENDKPTGRYVVEAKIVNYNSIESAEFIIEDSKLANLFRKNLKAYNAIQVHGHINVVNHIEEANDEEDDDCWGTSNTMDNKRVSGSTYRELVITGAKPSTIDKDSYSEKAINDAIKKVNASKQAEQNFSGKATTTNSTDDDDDWGDDSFEDDSEPW